MNLELLRKLTRDLPASAKVYREADHSQNPEASPVVTVTRDTELPYYGEDITWENIQDIPVDQVTAINIC